MSAVDHETLIAMLAKAHADGALDDRARFSVVARRNGVAPNLLYRWRRLMLEGGSVAVAQDARGRTPARSFGQLTVRKTDLARALAAEGRFPVKVVAQTLGVARSNLIDRLKVRTKPRRRYQKAQDAAIAPRIATLVAARPIYGYRRITAILNRQLRSEGSAPVNHKRVYRIMQVHHLRLARKYTQRPEHVHDGKVIAMRSNLRWCSDDFEFACWNGDIIHGAFLIDAHDREIIAWCTVVNAGISGSDIRDIMLEAAERRFKACRAPAVIEMLSEQWVTLHRKRNTDLPPPARPETLLHAGAESAK